MDNCAPLIFRTITTSHLSVSATIQILHYLMDYYTFFNSLLYSFCSKVVQTFILGTRFKKLIEREREEKRVKYGDDKIFMRK